MGSNIIYSQGQAEIVVPAGEKIQVFTRGQAQISRQLGYPNVPETLSLLQTLSNGVYTSAAFASGATIVIENVGEADVLYQVGTDPAVTEILASQYQPDPDAVNATATLDPENILSGIITSTTASGVTATLPTGANMDAASEFSVNDSVDWSVINTGSSNAFTVTAGSTHTVVGAGAVAALTTGRFRTRKTAASTFVTYRVG